jgi:hypothetical protein
VPKPVFLKEIFIKICDTLQMEHTIWGLTQNHLSPNMFEGYEGKFASTYTCHTGRGFEPGCRYLLERFQIFPELSFGWSVFMGSDLEVFNSSLEGVVWCNLAIEMLVVSNWEFPRVLLG